MPEYKVKRTDKNVITVTFDNVRAGWEQWVLLSSDRHHDNPDCNRKLEKKHLDEAGKKDALIVDVGDLFCAMQGRYDPRRKLGDVRPEDVGDNYLDLIVKHAAEFYGPYAKNWLLMGVGNHESKIEKNNSHNINSALIHRMNSDYAGHVFHGHYGGYIKFNFKIRKTVRQTKLLYYHHGAGGGGPVTRGVIQTNRQSVYLASPTIVLNGHTHDSWILPIKRERVTSKGRINHELIWFVRTPGYKDGWGKGEKGFEVETWKGPRPLGAAWLRFYYDGENVSEEITQSIQ